MSSLSRHKTLYSLLSLTLSAARFLYYPFSKKKKKIILVWMGYRISICVCGYVRHIHICTLFAVFVLYSVSLTFQKLITCTHTLSSSQWAVAHVCVRVQYTCENVYYSIKPHIYYIQHFYNNFSYCYSVSVLQNLNVGAFAQQTIILLYIHIIVVCQLN